MVALPLREVPSGCSDYKDSLEENFKNRSVVHLRACSAVPLLRKSIWMVVRGMVRLGSVSINGDERLLGLAGPNEIFGESLSNVEAYEAVAMTDCDVLCISLSEINDSPSLALAMFHSVSARYRQAESILALLSLRLIEDRVKAFLELIALDYGQICEEGLRLNLRLTHHELASALGTTRVTTTRVIGQLREEEWLMIDSSRHFIISSL